LKSKINNQTVGGVSVRKGLVVIQFAIAQILVIATLVVLQQLDFFRSAPLGFDKDSIVVFSVPTDSLNQTRFEGFRNKLLQEPEVKNVTFNFTEPLSGSNRRSGFQFNNSPEDAPFEVNVKYADIEYFSTYDLSLVAGRLYQSSDTAREYVVNETFLEKFGITDPEEGLGKTITMGGRTLPIVGVLKDFHLLSLQEKIEPLTMMCSKSQYRKAGVKLHADNMKEVTRKIEGMYRSFFPGNVFEYKFFDENVAKQYAQEERLSSITKIFSGIAIFISSLGLYGLISFMAVQRTKEVGIRKVLGATVSDIVLLFYKEFVVLVLIAFIVSAPLTAYFMSDWLNTFAYRISLGPWIFILAIALSVIISVITISFQSVKAALANPVDSLRNE
jgi:putative ABC transport system permease protein